MNSTSSSSDSDAPGDAGRTRSRSGEPLQDRQQHKQLRQGQQQGQEHDVRRMLDLALFNLSRAQLATIASELHPTSRAHRSLALSALPHLSLERFDDTQYLTCEVVYWGPLGQGCFARPFVPDVPIPWDTLAALHAAGGALESLDIRQCQAEPLLAGSSKAATAPVVAATLAGLRCLRVTELAHEDDSWDHFGAEPPEESYKQVQLQCVGRLISSCSGLTKLVFATADPECYTDGYFLRDVFTPAAADDEEQVAGGQGQEQQQQGEQQQEGTIGTRQRGLPLPHLRHLEVSGLLEGCLPNIMGTTGLPGLTSCRVTAPQEMLLEDFISLAACSKLQELHLGGCFVWSDMGADGLVPIQHLQHNRALTKLVLDDCGVEEPLLRAVCVLTQLRHLDLRDNYRLVVLPPDLSSLQQLTFLDISGTRVEELPQQLGKWLPQLQVLGVDKTQVAAIPQGLQHLTCLRAGDSSIPPETAA
jgi:hypothetical protein